MQEATGKQLLQTLHFLVMVCSRDLTNDNPSLDIFHLEFQGAALMSTLCTHPWNDDPSLDKTASSGHVKGEHRSGWCIGAGYNAKRDRWNGYDPAEHKKYSIEVEKHRLREEENDKQTTPDMAAVCKVAKAGKWQGPMVKRANQTLVLAMRRLQTTTNMPTRPMQLGKKDANYGAKPAYSGGHRQMPHQHAPIDMTPRHVPCMISHYQTFPRKRYVPSLFGD